MDKQITITDKTLEHLESTRKWTLFMSMFGFGIIGLMILFAFTYQAIVNEQPQKADDSSTTFMLILILSLTVAYTPPILLLYRFSTQMKMAIRNRQDSLIESAFKALRLHYTFLSILILVVGALYLISGVLLLQTGIIKI